jgi:competence protein ComEC
MNFPSFWKFLTPLLLGYLLPEIGWIFVLLLFLASAYQTQYALTINLVIWTFGALAQSPMPPEESWSSDCQVLVEITRASSSNSKSMEAKVVSGSLKPGQRLLIRIHPNENQAPGEGEFWWVQGRAEWPAQPRIPSAYSEQKVLKKKGLNAVLKVHKNGLLCQYSAPHSTIKDKDLQAQMAHRIQARSPNPTVGYFFRALLLGDKSELPRATRDAFRRTGLSHLLAVSGLHVGILFAGLALILNRIPGKNVGVSFFKAFFLCLGLLGYCWLTGFSASVIRASLMLGFAQCLMVFRRQSSGVQILAWVVFFLFALDPEMLWDGGFQLSVLAVVGILVLEPRLRRFKPPKFPNWLWSSLVVSFSAQLITAPILLSWGTTFPTWFLLTNLIAIPLTTSIMYIGLAWSFLLLFSISFDGLDAAVSWLVSWYLKGIDWMGSWPASELVFTTPNSMSLVLIYGIIVALVWRVYLASPWPYLWVALLWAGWFWYEEAERRQPLQLVLSEKNHTQAFFLIQGSSLKDVLLLDSSSLPLRLKYKENTFIATQLVVRPEVLNENDVLIWLSKKAPPTAWIEKLPPGIKKYTLQSWADRDWIRLQDSTDILLHQDRTFRIFVE